MKYVFVMALAVGLAVLFFVLFPRVHANYATTACLKYHYIDKTIDIVITDNEDIQALKSILAGRSYKEYGVPACGFDVNVSITLTDGQRSITFCPACDGCPVVRIGGTDRYIDLSEERRKQLDAIMAKYGALFPCV